MDFVIVGIICAALAFFFDVVDLVMLARSTDKSKFKSLANAVSVCLKLLAYLLCIAGGARDFTHELVDMRCFNAEGNDLADSAKDGVRLFEMVTLLTIGGTFVLAPMSMKWGGQLVGLPYARVH
jgi:hypothetical protein